MSQSKLQEEFPQLKRAPFSITSPEDPFYNCIAWAADDNRRWWWPISYQGQTTKAYWPPGVPRTENLPAFIAAFATLGYASCNDGKPERGFEKVALFADANGKPKHAARLLPTGKWTSKCGPLEDISHLLHNLEGRNYGSVAQYLKRRKP